MGDLSEKKISLSIPFATPETAKLAYDVLSVDSELKGSGVRREFILDGINIKILFQGVELKRLRVAVNSVLKNIFLIVKTLEVLEGR